MDKQFHISRFLSMPIFEALAFIAVIGLLAGNG